MINIIQSLLEVLTSSLQKLAVIQSQHQIELQLQFGDFCALESNASERYPERILGSPLNQKFRKVSPLVCITLYLVPNFLAVISLVVPALGNLVSTTGVSLHGFHKPSSKLLKPLYAPELQSSLLALSLSRQAPIALP